jgi:hypothetical protein
MSPALQARLIKTDMVSQGSQNLALGLAKTAASQLDEFVRGLGFLGKVIRKSQDSATPWRGATGA